MGKRSLFFVGALGLGLALYSVVGGAAKPASPQYDWEKMRKSFASSDVQFRKLLLKNSIEVLKHMGRSTLTRPSEPDKKQPKAALESLFLGSAWAEDAATAVEEPRYCFVDTCPGNETATRCDIDSPYKDHFGEEASIQCKDKDRKVGTVCNSAFFGPQLCWTTQSGLAPQACAKLAEERNPFWLFERATVLGEAAAKNSMNWQYFKLSLRALAQLCDKEKRWNQEVCKSKECKAACKDYLALLVALKRNSISKVVIDTIETEVPASSAE